MTSYAQTSLGFDNRKKRTRRQPGAYRTGQAYLTMLTPTMVADAPDPINAFAEYTQQVLGVPWATTKDLVILRQRINDLFHHYPKADYYTLCRLVQWCKGRDIRRSRVYQVVDLFRDAWRAGVLPELDTPREAPDVERRIADALTVETDPSWRRRLIGARGVDARRAVLAAWLEAHV